MIVQQFLRWMTDAPTERASCATRRHPSASAASANGSAASGRPLAWVITMFGRRPCRARGPVQDDAAEGEERQEDRARHDGTGRVRRVGYRRSEAPLKVPPV